MIGSCDNLWRRSSKQKMGTYAAVSRSVGHDVNARSPLAERSATSRKPKRVVAALAELS